LKFLKNDHLGIFPLIKEIMVGGNG
jgi:hypothetical protein